jgi:hypothetical protein
MCFLISSTSKAGMKPGSTRIRARRHTLVAVSLPIPAISASSLAGVNAIDSTVVKPDFWSLLIVVVATPLKVPGSITSATELSSELPSLSGI